VSAPALSIAAALRIIVESLRPTAAETVSLTDAHGRVLAQSVRSEHDLPPWTNSAMDGYACRAADVEQASAESPVRLRVIETVAAGAFASRELNAGEAVRIMTGAPVPQDADTVIRVEDTDTDGDRVLVRNARDVRKNLRPRGEDVRSGDTVVESGATLRAAEIGMLAAVGAARVEVYRRPRVAILSSGDELVTVDNSVEARAGRRIVSANNYSLAAMVAEAGGEPVDLGIVPDQLEALTSAMGRASEFDLLVTSGGISVGGFDYTRAAVEALGGAIHFWRVPMRPGYNSAFGEIRRAPWIGVPGNPVSALVAGEVLIRPAVRRLGGASAPFRSLQRVIAAETLTGAKTDTVFLRATLEYGDGPLPRARLTGPQGSAILSSLVHADALLVVDGGRTRVEPGEQLDAILLR